MTDVELVQLLRDSLPEDLSSEQIEALRRRMPHCSELRRALSEQLQLEQTLCGALGEVQVSLDWIFAQAASAGAVSGLAKLFGWGSTTALVLAVASVGVLVERRWAALPPPPPVQMAAVVANLPERPRGERVLPPADVARAADVKAIGPAPPAEPEGPVVASPSDALAAPPVQPLPAEPEPAAQETAPPQLQKAAGRANPNRPQEDAGIFTELPGGEFERLEARLEAVEGAHRPVFADGHRLPGLVLGGLATLSGAWPEDAALRVRPAGGQRLQLHLWNGVQGVSLEMYCEPRAGWAAYRTTRRLNAPRPLTRCLVATDGDRYGRCGLGTFDLRLQDVRLLLTRGDVLLLTVPLAARPETIVFEGAGTIRDLALVPCRPLTYDERERTNALGAHRPDQLEWQRELPAGAQWSFLAEGRGELLAEDTAAPAWAAASIPDLGLREVVFELEDPLPGSGVYLGDAAGRPRVQLGFFSDETTGQTSFGWVQPGEMRTTAHTTPGLGPAPLSDLRPWLRLVLAGGTLRCAVSADGTHWSEALEPLPIVDGGLSTAGLYALPGGGTRCLRVRRMEARRLSAIESLAPASLRSQVSGLDSAVDFAAWRQLTLETLPRGVDPEAWRRACAVELLASAMRPDLASAAVLELLRSAISDQAIPLERRLALLNEAALIFDASAPGAVEALLQHYEQLGRAAMNELQARPFSFVRRSLLAAPLWTAQPIDALPPALIRAELSQRTSEGEDGQAAAFCRRIAFFAGDFASRSSPGDGDHAEVRQLISEFEAAESVAD
jgi:hypothetical protein